MNGNVAENCIIIDEISTGMLVMLFVKLIDDIAFWFDSFNNKITNIYIKTEAVILASACNCLKEASLKETFVGATDKKIFPKSATNKKLITGKYVPKESTNKKIASKL